MSSHSQFSLLKTRQFLPFFIVQTLGAFNDNIFKNALMILLTFSAADALPWSTTTVVNLAAGLFILPFFLFSAMAGDIADRVEKSQLIRYIKAAEIIIMLLAALSFYFELYLLQLGILFLMGTQSAFFGPVKYAILPQIVPPPLLVGGNALVEMGTFLSILTGTIIGGILAGFEQAPLYIGLSVMCIAVIGFSASRYIPVVDCHSQTTPWRWQPIQQMRNTLRIAKNQRSIFLSILAISWFWFLGASYLTQLPNYSKTYLGGDSSLVTGLLVAFSVGVALGSLLCEKLSGKQIELGIVPIGSIGLTIFSLDLAMATPEPLNDQLYNLSQFLTQPHAWRIIIDLTLIGVFGGFFIVPLYALLQQQAIPQERAKVIAANNIYNALFMVGSAVCGILLLSGLSLSLPQYFLFLAVVNLIVAIYVYRQLPMFLLRFVIWILSHTFYRVTHQGLQHIPAQGAAVLICNHVSYMDSLIIAGAIRRPIRFIMDSRIYQTTGLHWFFKTAQTIPICPQHQDPEIYDAAFKQIKQQLDAGELVCIFPEGKLTKDGQINPFRHGIEQIITTSPVKVIPMALNGLWGSFFSHHGQRIFSRSAPRFWSKVSLKASSPIPAEQVNAAYLEQKVRQLCSKSD